MNVIFKISTVSSLHVQFLLVELSNDQAVHAMEGKMDSSMNNTITTEAPNTPTIVTISQMPAPTERLSSFLSLTRLHLEITYHYVYFSNCLLTLTQRRSSATFIRRCKEQSMTSQSLPTVCRSTANTVANRCSSFSIAARAPNYIIRTTPRLRLTMYGYMILLISLRRDTFLLTACRVMPSLEHLRS